MAGSATSVDGDETDARFRVIEGPAHLFTSADREVVARLFADRSKKVRLRAAAALSHAIASDRAPGEFIDSLLKHELPEVRWVTAFACSKAKVTGPHVVDAALEALDVEDGDVRWAAAAIVTRAARDSAELCERLRSLATARSSRSRKMALLCLCDSGVRDGRLFRSALADPDPFVRLAALTCFFRSGDSSAQSLAAVRRTSETDDDSRVRRAGVAILARLEES